MKRKDNNIRVLTDIRDSIEYYLSYFGLSYMLPFCSVPTYGTTDKDFFTISYDIPNWKNIGDITTHAKLLEKIGIGVEIQSRGGKTEPILNEESVSSPGRVTRWSLFPNEDVAIAVSKAYYQKSKIYFLNHPGDPIPRHIEAIMRGLKERFRDSAVYLIDWLPKHVDIHITLRSGIKKNREKFLRDIAKDIIPYNDDIETVREKVSEIIKKETLIKKALGQMLALVGESSEDPPFSFCLMCGKEIVRVNKNGRQVMFCSQVSPNNCQNKLNAKLKSRGYATDLKRTMYNDLRNLLKRSPLSDFSDFKSLYSDIYKRKPRKGS